MLTIQTGQLMVRGLAPLRYDSLVGYSVYLRSPPSTVPAGILPRRFRNAHHHGIWPQQLTVAWDQLMIADPEGPSFITRTVGRRRYADDASVSHDPRRKSLLARWSPPGGGALSFGRRKRGRSPTMITCLAARVRRATKRPSRRSRYGLTAFAGPPC